MFRPDLTVLVDWAYITKLLTVSVTDCHKFSDDTQLFSSASPVDYSLLVNQAKLSVECDSTTLQFN